MANTALDRARKVRLILLDVDGVQTDRGIYLGADGVPWRRFDVRDGTGITVAQDAGIKVAFLSGKASPSIRGRAEELGVTDVYEGLRNKLEAYEEVKTKYDAADTEVAYLADDVIDLPVLLRVGLPLAVADAAPEVLDAAIRVMICPGGQGAVREAIEFIMHAQGIWDRTLKARYGL
jgi:3-deoxy-D-manno-octulosonate 8-phosphate phosphatase (KDO 8-P phosphatase)